MKKIFGLMVALLIAFAATVVNASDFVVTTSADRDGVCFSGVDCSLREAVKAANNVGSNDRILFLTSIENETFNLTLGRSLDVLPSGGGLAVVGSTAYGVHIRANGSRIFVLEPTSQPNTWYNLTLINLKLTGGRGAGGSVGGAVGVQFTNLTISSCWFEDNQAGQGGAVGIWAGEATIAGSVFINNIAAFGGGFLDFGSTVTVSQSSFVGNRARQLGGGMYLGSSATVVRNVTISGNISDEFGAGVHTSGSLINDTTSFEYVTVTNNQSLKWSTGGVGCDGGYFSASMSIFYGNRIQLPGSDTDLGATCLSNIGSNILGGTTPAPSLGPLVFDGLKPAYHPLLAGSFGIDRGFTTGSTLLDVRYSNRIADGNGDGVFLTDNGAAEFGNLVNNDADDFRVGSLRRAINDAGQFSEIVFDPGFFSTPRGIEAVNGEFAITKNLTIIGPGPSLLALVQTGQFSVVAVRNGGVLTLSGVSIADGNSSGVGGGINNDGTLNLSNAVVAGNRAGFGGGIYNGAGRTANVRNSTITGNTSGGGGGGIGNAGTFFVHGSTIMNNSATFGGAATAGSMLIVNNSTISGNVARTNKAGGVYIGTTERFETTNTTISNNFSNADLTGGVYSDGGVFQARNTLVAGNFGGFAADVAGTIFSFGYNFIGISAGNQFASNSPSLAGNIVNAAPNLAPLGFYGGPTRTHALLPNSPAINAGDPGTSVFTTDQRGASRPIGAQDIGAFETNIVVTPATIPAGEVGRFFSQALTTTRLPNQFSETADEDRKSSDVERVAPFTMSILPISGQSLPPGINLTSESVLSGTPTTAGSYTFTTLTVDADGMAGTSVHTMTVSPNQPPTLTPVGISRPQGSAAAPLTIATVSDATTSAGAIAVTVTSANPLNGVTISNIVNTNGVITANVATACNATNASFAIRATDGGNATTNATLNVSIVANTPPSLAYQSVGLQSGYTVSHLPTVNSDNGALTYSLSVTPEFLPAPTVQSNGTVLITNARGQGDYNFAVTATDVCGLSTTANFVANVFVVVNKTGDTNDGICDSDCSLREAIDIAAPGTQVGFSSFFSTDRTIALGSPLSIAKSLTILGTTRTTIDAQNLPNSRIFDINADNSKTIAINNLRMIRGNNPAPGGAISMIGGATLNLDNVTLESNNSGLVGGALYASQGRVNISNSRFRGNSVSGGGIGGAIYMSGGEFFMTTTTVAGNTVGGTGTGGGIGFQGVSPARFERSTISGNSARSGGGIVISGGAVRLANSTLSDNAASLDGGGVFNYSGGQLIFSNSTIAGNTAQNRGGGLFNDLGSMLAIGNTIVGDNTAPNGPDIGNGGMFNASGANIVENGPIGGTVVGVAPLNVDARLLPLADNGGPTPTRSFEIMSPAYDGGVNSEAYDTNGFPMSVDQRGFARVAFGTVDIGAYEMHVSRVTVTNANDAGPGSLRQAIADAPGGSAIIFSPTFFNQPRTIALQTGIVLNKSLNILGPGADLLTIDGENRAGLRLLTLDGGGHLVEISGVKLTRGNMSTVGSGGGGALFVRNASVKLTNVVVENNRAADSGGGISAIAAQTVTVVGSRIVGNQIINGGEAGGVYCNGANFVIRNSTISGNSAATGGGATFIFATSAKVESSTFDSNSATDGGGIYSAVSGLRLSNVTVSGNTASNRGGGVYHGGSNSSLAMRNSTIAGNSAVTGGGIFLNSGTSISTLLANMIVADNIAPTAADFWVPSGHSVVLAGVDLIESGFVGGGSVTGAGNMRQIDPKLGPLANYGGTTQTRALLGGSPALNAGVRAEAIDTNDVALVTDQRGAGAPRMIGAEVDLGAFEMNLSYDQPTLPAAILNRPYNLQLSITRQSSLIAMAPQTFEVITIAGESLPPGVTLSGSGLLAGSPTAGGNFKFTVKATDQDGIAGIQSFNMNVLVPTAANVTVGGRLTTASGNPIRGAVVTLTSPDGRIRSVTTGTFGNYVFDEVASGAAYVVGVNAKKYRFAETTRVVMVADDVSGVDFVTQE